MAGPSVVLADDHAMVAEGLASLLATHVRLLEVVHDGRALLESARRLRPELVVSDVNMPVMSGLEAMQQLRSERIDTRFIFLTMHEEPRLAVKALRAGASGYLLKQAAGDELLAAIRDVMQGRTYVTPLLTSDVLSGLATPPPADDSALSPRQRDVLRLVARGMRMKEIAAELGISVRTVESYKYEAMRLLGAGSTADLVKFALKMGLIEE